ncbi:MAG: hypothetical protein QG641_1088 [Candidatus Poribacteria bacterium]|nr:hypothetical protein [Candidatus Poribacteria bacterium]
MEISWNSTYQSDINLKIPRLKDYKIKTLVVELTILESSNLGILELII